MLKITRIDSGTQVRLVLSGALLPPWFAELRTAWLSAQSNARGRKVVLDFQNVTQISPEGELVLSALVEEGAKLSSGGVLTRHILQQIISKCKKKPPQVRPLHTRGNE